MSGIGKQQINVIVADSQTLINDGISSLLSATNDIHVLAQPLTGKDALDLVIHHHPDILLTAIDLEDMSGLEVIKSVKQELKLSTKIIVVTNFDLAQNRYFAQKFGACEYLLKTCTGTDLIETIRRVAHADPAHYISRTLARTEETPDFSIFDDEFARLTTRELEVTQRIIEGETNAQIAQFLDISLETVKTHVKHIMEKIHASNRAQIVSLAYEHTRFTHVPKA